MMQAETPMHASIIMRMQAEDVCLARQWKLMIQQALGQDLDGGMLQSCQQRTLPKLAGSLLSDCYVSECCDPRQARQTEDVHKSNTYMAQAILHCLDDSDIWSSASILHEIVAEMNMSIEMVRRLA